MSLQQAANLGISLFEDANIIERKPNDSDERISQIINAAYRQVLGNSYIMSSERLVNAESRFRNGQLSVRDFVRAIANSDLYRQRFFEPSPRYRFTELNFKHLLGRTPENQEEMRYHSDILDTLGYEADIDAYLDSDEYSEAYGDNIVPYYRGYKTDNNRTMVEFTHLFAMLRGAASSDSNKSPVIHKSVLTQTPLSVIPPSGGAAGAGWAFQDTPLTSATRQGVGAGDDGKIYRVEVTGYRAKVYNSFPKYRRPNKVYMVPFNKLFQLYQTIHKQGASVASVTPVN
ncbi:phycobilisome phycoerythrin-associated linker polypeptide [Geminocystis sp. NIES-3708]|uniref:phycobilisome linker polypeptide n=1 Tax=Geminocystis sp. NIES-3708 TaxID=1615909 RepID=UPI0005FCA356|nr:phycobilisome linker polypeptide [Geminocystis sp. NIES-3708]BAQ61070.1 phycobilisome phycoerythrin-associated linker polypeptide [Geminocystis sp. NIES-3708]